jgi:23S rRNA G2445 N2-methylase RlmL
VTTVPGLAQLCERELRETPGLAPTGSGNDGRADVIAVRLDAAEDAPRALQLATCEDVFACVAALPADEPVGRLATQLLARRRLARAIELRNRAVGHPLKRRARVRVIARLLDERRFRRTQLRDALLRSALSTEPQWRLDDPADIEIWAIEWRRGHIMTGVRVSDASMRHGGGRRIERQGALRPVVARAMLRLAGPPRSGVLLDPFCGSGTILREASTAGWAVRGFDVDRDAVRTAAANAPAAVVEVGDARKLPLGDGHATAIVSNMPFGDQFTLQDDPSVWLPAVLAEMVRVLQPGGGAVLLYPHELPARKAGLEVESATRLTLLGKRTRLWLLRRR